MTEQKEVKLLDNKLENFNDYIDEVMRTESGNHYPTDIPLLQLVLSMNINTTEILDGFKKQIYYGNPAKLKSVTMNALQAIAIAAQTAVERLAFEEDGKRKESIKMAEDGETVLCEPELTEMIPEPAILHTLLGVMTESGELGVIFSKALAGIPIDKVNLQEEFCDINWYQGVAHRRLGLDFYQGLTNNINKLRRRFPEKFTEHDAEHRKLDAERTELAKGIDAALT
jgi:hypothetical protein